jgi:hypothetical protein
VAIKAANDADLETSFFMYSPDLVITVDAGVDLLHIAVPVDRCILAAYNHILTTR